LSSMPRNFAPLPELYGDAGDTEAAPLPRQLTQGDSRWGVQCLRALALVSSGAFLGGLVTARLRSPESENGNSAPPALDSPEAQEADPSFLLAPGNATQQPHLVNCSAFSCPTGYVLRPDAQSVQMTTARWQSCCSVVPSPQPVDSGSQVAKGSCTEFRCPSGMQRVAGAAVSTDSDAPPWSSCCVPIPTAKPAPAPSCAGFRCPRRYRMKDGVESLALKSTDLAWDVCCVPSDDIPSSEQSTNVSDTRKVAYVWYLTKYHLTSYSCGVLVAIAMLQDMYRARANAEFVVMHTPGVNPPHKPSFEKRGVKFVEVAEPRSRGSHQWVESFTKVHTSHLFQYDRLVFMDSDTVPLSNMDELFDLSPFPVPMACPRAYWIAQPWFQSGGPCVVDPYQLFYDRYFKESLEKNTGHWGGEMDYLNEKLKHVAPLLSGFYALLTGEFCRDDGAYHKWSDFFGQAASWVRSQARMIHFIAQWKPWDIPNAASLRRKCPHMDPELLEIYQTWWSWRSKVC